MDKMILPVAMMGSVAMLAVYLRSVDSSAPTHQPEPIRQFDGLWVQTSDDQVMYLTPEIVNECEMFKIGTILYPNTSEEHPVSKIRFTQEQMTTFINALENCSSINYERDLNTLMTVAERCKAYMLYAHCVSRYLNKQNGIDTDQTIIVPLLKTITLNSEPDFLLNTMVSLRDVSFTLQDECQSKSNAKNPLKVKLYNLAKKQAHLGHQSKPRLDKKYVAFQVVHDLFIYNIENFDLNTENFDLKAIKYKKIALQDKTFTSITISPNSHHLAAIIHGYKVFYWQLSDFDWNNEHYVPMHVVLKDNIREAWHRLKFYNNNLFINLLYSKKLEIVDLENRDSNGDYYRKTLDGHWEVCQKIDLAIKMTFSTESNSTYFEIYSIKDLSNSGNLARCLYSNTVKCNLCKEGSHHSNASYLAINIKREQRAILLRYDATNNIVSDSSYIIKGCVCDLNDKGWVVAASLKNTYDLDHGYFHISSCEKFSVCDNRGKQIISSPRHPSVYKVELSPNGHDLNLFKHFDRMDTTEQICYSIWGNKKPCLQFKATFYTPEELEQCNALYDNITSEQYAFFNTMHADYYPRTIFNSLYLEKNSTMEAAFNSFATTEDKNFVKEKLKVIEPSK